MCASDRLVLLSLTVAAVACTQPQPATDTAAAPDTAGAVAAITAVRDREIGSLASGNAEQLVSAFTADAYVMPPNEPAVEGHDGLTKWIQAFTSQFNGSGRYTSSTVTVAGDYAFERYTAELTLTPKAGGAAMTEQVKGIHVYKREPDGSWKIYQDAWNSSTAPAAVPAPAAR